MFIYHKLLGMKTIQLKIKNYGQQRLSNESGVHKSTVSQVANGNRDFSKEAARVVAPILKVSLAVALGMDN